MHKSSIEGSILGFDFGMKHIGVALGITSLQSTRPLSRLKAKDGVPCWQQIEDLIATWDAKALVVGLPLNADGSTQAIMLAAKKFSQRLQGRFKLPVFLVDERYTTKQAKREYRAYCNKSLDFDSIAAKIILESWLQEFNQNNP